MSPSPSYIDLAWAKLPAPVEQLSSVLRSDPHRPDSDALYAQYSELMVTQNCFLRLEKSEFYTFVALLKYFTMCWDASNIRLHWPRPEQYMTPDVWESRESDNPEHQEAWASYRQALEHVMSFTVKGLPIPSFKLNGNPGWLITADELKVALQRYPGIHALAGLDYSVRLWTRLLLFMSDAAREGDGIRVW